MENKEPDDDLFDRLNVSKTKLKDFIVLSQVNTFILAEKAHCIDVYLGRFLK